MSLPDDLTPKEAIELQRLIGDVQNRTVVPDAEWDEQPLSEIEKEQLADALQEAVVAQDRPNARELLSIPRINLNDGNGWWNGHTFTMSPEQLKRVLAIVTESIEASLTAEIERLRREML